MFENENLLAWAVYAVAALGCLLVCFRLTSWMWRYVREPLRVLVAVLLFSPTIVDPSKELFAPAIAVSALDILFKVGNNLWRAVADLALYGMIAFAVYLIFVAIRWPIERWWKERRQAKLEPQDESDPRTLREIMDDGDAEPNYAQHDRHGMRVEPRL
ncbi:MFS transporter [Pseudomonas sp. M30-35]|uniref:MFS transporter n=1 Tax=Pseudomonas sp. M30-35 TaxID=1981174 RepID=UPI0015B1F6EC|nr:MFS transporter [Pseudomonas sp. M30-35]